ncbi:COA8 family protein CG14806, mitochondrial [Stomoxys calcitrans]|uniref:COA8 family protein CG14806, mitochondrial n=1 Tax=Stomoxys calcitrans TaxID=35570 RepID=UPI0027E2F913|nr:COA8 family protein CG14806, mitochondrial [Stomoxys calcitrans]
MVANLVIVNIGRISRTFCSSCNPPSKICFKKPDANLIKCDYIGPPDKISNIRPFVRSIPDNETELQKKLRLKRTTVEEWNHSFWSRHNKRFYDEKKDFVRLHSFGGIDDISPDKISEFYKLFLDKNRRLHILYNFSWYWKNFEILFLAFRVEIVNILKLRRNVK